MKVFIILVCMLFPFCYSHAAEQIIFYRVGEKDQASWRLLKNYFDSKGYNVSIYEKADTLQKHLENVNRMNRSRASLMLAIDFRLGDKNDVFVAVTDAKKGDGKILSIEEVPEKHIANSTEFAQCSASSFGKTVKVLPLFPLLGVDMPAAFLRMESTNDKMDEMLNTLHDCLQKYFKRSVKK